MSKVQIISVNPAKKTLGALHPELLEKVARTCRIPAAPKPQSIFKTSVNTFFGINKGMTKAVSSRLLLTRVLLGVWFIISGITAGIDPFTINLSMLSTIFGGMLVLGILNRPASLAAAVLFAISAVGAATDISGTITLQNFISSDPFAILSCILCISIAICGPGLFSVDQLIRRSMLHLARTIRKRNATRKAERRLSYRAFQYSAN